MSPEGPTQESVIVRLRPHGRTMFWPSLALIVIMGLAGYFFGYFPEVWQNLGVLIGAVLAALLLWLIPFLAWLGRHYTITTRRVILRSGFLVRIRQELLHSRGYDVTVRATSIQSLFGSGDVQINTGLDRPVVLRDVPSAALVQEVLQDLMEEGQNPIASRRQQEDSRPSDETTIWGTR